MKKLQSVTVLVPLYNEAAALPQLFARLDRLFTSTTLQLDVLLVDDGSTDSTVADIKKFTAGNSNYSALFLSRNFGHAMALTAGLKYIAERSDAVFIIDADLQDPPELLPAFIKKLEEGNDVVYGIRKGRKESITKRICYKLFYRLQHRFSNVKMPLDAGDFSLLSQRVVLHMNALPEESRYLRGMRSWVGFSQAGIEYERAGRTDGDSKYPMKALLSLAFNGIFNFSEFPIRFISRLGIVSVLIALVYLAVTLYKKIVFGTVPEGFTALIFAIVLFSGVQLLSLGIIGEYILRIFFQVKQRPLYIIKSKLIKGEVSDE